LELLSQGYSFDDVLLVPQHGVLEQRADADISTKLTKNHYLQIPIVSAPMNSVTEEEMAMAMFDAGGLGILHRFYSSLVDQWDSFKDVHFRDEHKHRTAGVAIGLKTEFNHIGGLYEAGCRIFCLDVAHGDTEPVYRYVEMFKDIGRFYDDIELIVGNVATAEATRKLCDLGADAIKVGIGPGAACSTREVTGFGVPQLTAIDWCAKEARKYGVPIIADGGIKNSGDCVKALAAGASSVMLGRLLAGSDEAPHPGEYFGMASKRVNGHNAPEGVTGTVESTGPVSETIKALCWGIRSGISYAGARNIKQLQENAVFIPVGQSTHIESGVRI
jgi:IMP dehydrogenase